MAQELAHAEQPRQDEMFCLQVIGPDVPHAKLWGVKGDFIDAARLDEAMRRANFVKGNGKPNYAALAEAVGVAASQPSSWRTETTCPSGSVLTRLCRALGVEPGYLMGLDEPDDKTTVIAAIVRKLPPAMQNMLLDEAEGFAKVARTREAAAKAERSNNITRAAADSTASSRSAASPGARSQRRGRRSGGK